MDVRVPEKTACSGLATGGLGASVNRGPTLRVVPFDKEKMQDQQNFLKRCANGGTLFSYATVVSFLFSAYCNSSCVGWITFLYIVLPCVAAVVSRPPWRMLVLLIARYVSNLINEHYYYYYYLTTERYAIDCIIHCWGYQ